MLNLKFLNYRPVAATEGKITTKGTRRGSVILIDPSLNVTPLRTRTIKDTEMIGVKVVGDTKKTYKNPFELWTVYSGPYNQEFKKCKTMLNQLQKEKKHRLLIAGDMNSNLAPQIKSERCQVKDALEHMEEKGQANILNSYEEPTTTNKNGSILDLAITMGDWKLGFTYPINWDLGSIHFPVFIGLNTGEEKDTNQSKNPPIYKINDENIKKVTKKCKEIKGKIEKLNENELAKEILNTLQCAKTTKNSKKKNPKHWWNEEINTLFYEKQEHLRTNGKDEAFKQKEEKLQHEISKAKNKEFQAFATGLNHTNNNNDVFKAMKQVGIRPSSKITELALKTIDEKVITSSLEKVNHLSRRYQVPLGHFPNIKKERKEQLLRKREEMEQNNPIGQDHIPFTLEETQIARKDMANNKAPGLSKIRKEHLEMGGEEMDNLVTELANKIALSGVWPESLKSATICPLPKDNLAKDIISEEDTRPISLLEALDKWLQKIFYNRIIQHIQYHDTQAGYSLSCDHHTSLVSDFVMNRKDDAYTIAVFTDISKAFDSVPHHELINVIWDSNIPSPYKWVITSFVENRYFRVELKNSKGQITASKWRKMLFGTPQGSVLGPLLWNLFFDPLLTELEKKQS